MATGNFYNKNASKIFAFGLEDEEDYPIELQYKDIIDNVRYDLQKIIRESSDIFEGNSLHINDSRSFPGSEIMTLSKTICIGDVETIITLSAVVRSGYYQGANLDWVMSLDLMGSGFDSIEDISLPDFIEITNWCSDMSVGLRTMLYPKYIAKLAIGIANLIEVVENTFSEYTTTYGVFARFSNGETMYCEI